MDFGIFNLMGFRQLGRPSEDVIRESIEQTRIAEEARTRRFMVRRTPFL